MTEMTMKEALELAIDAAEDIAAEYREMEDEKSAERYARAAAMLRDGGPVVEKTLDLSECGVHKVYCCGKTFSGSGVLRYKTREVLSIEQEYAEAIFEEIK